jgi:biopolymer transport protein TolR
MAGGLAAARGTGRRGRRSARRGRLAEINVTPFVDVMLVLLIVFMITAPLLTVSIPVELPRTKAETAAADVEPLALTITADGKIYLQETVVTLEELPTSLRAIAREGYNQAIYIRGDKGVDWDLMARVLAVVSGSGFRKLQLVTDTEDAPTRRGGR